jgi:hypothetical protein
MAIAEEEFGKEPPTPKGKAGSAERSAWNEKYRDLEKRVFQEFYKESPEFLKLQNARLAKHKEFIEASVQKGGQFDYKENYLKGITDVRDLPDEHNDYNRIRNQRTINDLRKAGLIAPAKKGEKKGEE